MSDFSANTLDSSQYDAWSAFIRDRFETSSTLTSAGMRERAVSLDRELLVMQSPRLVVMAKQYRNRSIEVCALPAEILSAIFACAKGVWEPKRILDDTAGCSYDLGYITITHVCSRWREVALNAPSLWSVVDTYAVPSQLCPVFLQRSKSLDLNLEWNKPVTKYKMDKKAKGALSTWLRGPILQRTRKLALYNLEERVLRTVQGLDADMASLEELIIGVNPHMVPGISSLPLTAFTPHGSTSSKIYRLSLSNCLLDWSSPCFSDNLTDLKLVSWDYPASDAHLPQLREFLRLLSRMTGLVSLKLSNVFPIDDQSSNLGLPLVLPSSFRRLDLSVKSGRSISQFASSATVRRCLTLMKYLVAPSTAKQIIHIPRGLPRSITRDPSDSTVVRDSVTGIFTVNDGDTRTTLEELELRRISVTATYVTLPAASSADITTSTRHFISGLGPGLYVNMTRDASDEDGHVSYQTPYLCLGPGGVLLHTIRKLSFSVGSGTLSSMLKREPADGQTRSQSCFETAVNVRTVALIYPYSHGILSALAETRGDCSFILFPCLHTLEVTTVDDFMLEQGISTNTQVDVALVALLQARRDAGIPIQKIRVAKELRGLSVWSLIEESVEEVQVEFVEVRLI